MPDLFAEFLHPRSKHSLLMLSANASKIPPPLLTAISSKIMWRESKYKRNKKGQKNANWKIENAASHIRWEKNTLKRRPIRPETAIISRCRHRVRSGWV